MKLIIAIIEPHLLTDVKKALFDAQIYKMTVSNVLGCGQQPGYTETYRGIEQEIFLLKKIRLELAVNEDFLEPAIRAISEAAYGSGKENGEDTGDGKIFILDLYDCIKIRTGERGTTAI